MASTFSVIKSPNSFNVSYASPAPFNKSFLIESAYDFASSNFDWAFAVVS